MQNDRFPHGKLGVGTKQVPIAKKMQLYSHNLRAPLRTLSSIESSVQVGFQEFKHIFLVAETRVLQRALSRARPEPQCGICAMVRSRKGFAKLWIRLERAGQRPAVFVVHGFWCRRSPNPSGAAGHLYFFWVDGSGHK